MCELLKRILQTAIVFVALYSLICHGVEITAPPGWTKSVDKTAKTIAFQPANPSDRSLVLVKYYPKTPLNGLSVQQWVAQKLSTSRAPQGQWTSEPVVKKLTGNYARGFRSFTVNGIGKRIEIVAASVDFIYVRMSAAIMVDSLRSESWYDTAAQLTADILLVEKAIAKEQKRGLKVEPSPPDVPGIKRGGEIQSGRYIGNKTSGEKIISQHELLIFANGEFQFLKGERIKDGRINYSPATGRLNITGDFYNSTYDPHEDFCVYGIEAQSGTPIIYMEDYWGIGTYIARLRRVGDVDRSPPSEVKRRESLARQEAKRYKWVTRPGEGIKNSEIEAVVYTFDTEFSVTGLQKEEAAYLLLKDGRVMDGMPVPPDSLDLARSRSREPDRWGWWKKAGSDYVFAWPGRPDDYRPPRGSQFIANAIPKGTRLEGEWGSSSSYSLGQFSSVNFWGISFTKAGRFIRYQSGISQAGGEMNDAGPLVTSVSTDEGTTTSVIGSHVGGGTRTKSNNPTSDRMGWYEFQGFAIVLKYDSGREERLPVFSDHAESFKTLWFNHGTLSQKSKN